VLAGGMIWWVAIGGPARDLARANEATAAAVAEQPVQKDSRPTNPGGAPSKLLEHEVRPGETYEDIARYYGVSLAVLQKFNTVAIGEPAVPGSKLKVPTDKPLRPPLDEERYVVSAGDDWRSIAGYYGVSMDALRRQNPGFGDQLRGGEELRFMVEREPFAAASPNPDDLPIFIVPQGASSEGKVTSGTLRNAVQLLPSPLCSVRCSVHSFATGYTIKALLQGVAEFRRQGYTGELMIGDLSRRDGGQYGPHKSHQSGRDADIWLLPKGKVYKKGCNNCSTDRCKPEPEDIDWATQFRFIQALDAGGLVKEIFLSWRLQEHLVKAATAQGVPKEEIKRLIQWPKNPGWPALVMHSEGHVHHIHVRFKCDPEDAACSDARGGG
jgi:LysM repeat protein